MKVSQMEEKLDKVIEMQLQNHPLLPNGMKLVKPPLPVEYFTGRDEYLKVVEGCFEFPKTSVQLKKGRRFVFHGMGGMGKTQLALKFADLHRER